MKLDLNDMLYALSYALDCVEGELLGVKAFHSERVAFVAASTAQSMGMSGTCLSDLSAAAVLHDNALTEYIGSERNSLQERQINPDAKSSKEILAKELKSNFEQHCSVGEKNVQILPFYDRIVGAVQYHHENADGSGIYHLTAAETPVFAQLIHFADMLDNGFDLSVVNDEKHQKIHEFARRNSGTLFNPEIVEAFDQAFPLKTENLLVDNSSRMLLRDILPDMTADYNSDEVKAIAALFAHIIDYKSHFTCTHSIGIANKVHTMADFYGFDSEMQTKLYLAGALHDIGKCSIPNTVLEKPGKLEPEEFTLMKRHALISWQILDRIDGFEDIRDWAALHHEKLNGRGYPFGKSAEDLSFNDRLMACIDVYQALTESRPYRDLLDHKDAIAIMEDMASGDFIDSTITHDIDERFRDVEVQA